MNYAYLAVAIVAEVIGTSALSASDGFTRLRPTLLMAACFAISFYCLSLAMRSIPIGVVYATWSGVGIVLITSVAWFWFRQRLDAPAIAGIALIIAGVMIVNLFSKSSAH
ncbi:MAG: QacE family quaternary ammonium compound efflux SMR transporter [Rhizobiales bacterium 65-9]|nr:multidrug efflux SMR transporter [Hyphomicrobiales bacterium]OJY35610.1 MAG: QacE family quaternary ammonium compound efflux SMR transporter [Rhizobiales bacterium 65-9]